MKQGKGEESASDTQTAKKKWEQGNKEEKKPAQMPALGRYTQHMALHAAMAKIKCFFPSLPLLQ